MARHGFRNNSDKNHSDSFTLAKLDPFSGIPWDISVVTCVCVFGVLTNIINICVFHNSKLKGPSYKILLLKSISSVIYLTLSIASQYFNYCANCPTANSYFAKLFGIGVTFYLESSLMLFRALLDILVSLRRYCILVKKNWIGKYKLTFILILLSIISFGYYSNLLFRGRIFYNPWDKRLLFFIQPNYILDIFLDITHMFLAVIVLSAINIANLIEYKNLYKFREHLSKVIKEKEKELLTSKLIMRFKIQIN